MILANLKLDFGDVYESEKVSRQVDLIFRSSTSGTLQCSSCSGASLPRGYMSPEYALHGQFSVKSDVFSFGVLLPEIISGKRNRSFYHEGGLEDLLTHAWKLWKDGKAMELVDPTLDDSNSTSEVMRRIHIGLLCVQNDLDERPTTALVAHILSSDFATLPEPNRPACFKDYTRIRKFDQLSKNSIPLSSVCREPITEVYPR